MTVTIRAESTTGVIDKEKSNDWAKIKSTRHGLSSEWQQFYKPADTCPQGRWEGELERLVVYGTIPKEIDGTFYRIIIDPFMPPHPENGFVEGDGNACAIRISDGVVSMKVRYVDTERHLLERQAGRRLFGIYRNPYTNDPSTRYANDSTGNTNIIYWAGNILALAERGLPWAIDPDTLETRGYDPYAGQLRALTFTAHPKIDTIRNELVTWGYEAKGLGTTDVVTYSVTSDGRVKDVNWFNLPEVRMIHDGWITENWLILSAMPVFYTGDEELKSGKQHWVYSQDEPQIMVVCPRKPDTPGHPGWKPGEFRQYPFENGLIIHCGSAWEEDGKLHLESPWTQFNAFYFWNPPDMKPLEPTGKYVRWTIDLDKPTGSRIDNVQELSPWKVEFPVVDDRFNTQKQQITYLVGENILFGGPPTGYFVNSLIKLDQKTGKALIWDAGEGGEVSEPAFIPRSPDAPEGDGWLLCVTTRKDAPRGEMIILDTNDFTQPVAVVQMPFVMCNQLHGNWVPNPNPGTKLPNLARRLPHVLATGRGPLNRIP
ncbi:hypothetical protein ACN47E_002486 [Coniothyrium glycines]